MNWSEEILKGIPGEYYVVDPFGTVLYCAGSGIGQDLGAPKVGGNVAGYLDALADNRDTKNKIAEIFNSENGYFAQRGHQAAFSSVDLCIRGEVVPIKLLKNEDSSIAYTLFLPPSKISPSQVAEPETLYATGSKSQGSSLGTTRIVALKPDDYDAIATIRQISSEFRLSKNDPYLLETLLETLPDGIFLKDGMGRWQLVNSVAKKIFRLTDDGWVGKTDLELAKTNIDLAAVHVSCSQSDEAAWQKREITHCMECGPDASGELLYYDTIKMPLFNDDGSRKSIVVVARDVTEKKKNDDERLYDQLVQNELNKILKISLEDTPLFECLDKILKVVIHAPIVNLLPQGRIFLREEDDDVLSLVSQHNFTLSADSVCGSIEFGKCVCGNAASMKKPVYWDGVNDVEGITYIGSERGAHYAIPIISGDVSLGVLLVCIEIGHQQNQKEVLFLESVADILAGLINRKKAEERAVSSYTFLENLDRVNNTIQHYLSKGSKTLEFETIDLLMDIFSADFASIVSGFGKADSRCRLRLFGKPDGEHAEMEFDRLVDKTEEVDALKSVLVAAGEPVAFPDCSMMPAEVAGRAKWKGTILGVALIPKSDRPKLLLLHVKSDPKRNAKDKRLLNLVAERFSNSLNTLYLLNEVSLREETYKTLAETAKDIIVSYTPDGKLTYLNSIGMEFFGLKEKDFIGKSIFGFIPKEEGQKVVDALKDRAQGNLGFKILEFNLRNADGIVVPFESNSAPVVTNGEITGIVAFIRNIAERKSAEEILIRQNQELKTINEELDRFVYSTSHDLRAPLTSVVGLIGLARDSPDPDELQLYLDMMEKSIIRLDTVIKNILDYSKTNRLQPAFEPVDVYDIYKSIIGGVGYILHANNFNLVTEIDAKTPFVSDKSGMTTILSNLITNAIKYRRKDVVPFVKVSFVIDGTDGVVTVEDNGEGIPESKFERIFEMFYRNSSSADGSGLGLYIVRQNIIRLSGTINIESKEGVGTKFVVRIPNHAAQ